PGGASSGGGWAGGRGAGAPGPPAFPPAAVGLAAYRNADGAHYHPLPVPLDGTPAERARAFADAAARRLRDFPPFDLLHRHEWMTGLGDGEGLPTVLSLSSLETTRRNGSGPSELS